MTRIGVTGHQVLPATALDYIVRGIREELAHHRDVIGLSSLAAGSDQIFAVEVLRAGGRLHAVIPSDGYARTFTEPDLRRYLSLLSAADETTELGFAEPSETAFDAAGRWIAEHSDQMIAIWDGEPSKGLGGTADAVAHAREVGVGIRVIWPSGIKRAPEPPVS